MRRPLLFFFATAIAGCGGASDDTSAVETGDDHLTSGFEVQIGGPGDAEIASVTELADKSMLATFHMPAGVVKFGADGKRDPVFKGSAGGSVWRLYDAGDGFVLAPSESGEKHTYGLDRISRMNVTSGALDPAFGTNGVFTFPKTTAPEKSTVYNETAGVVATFDAKRAKIDSLLVHDWQLVGGGAGGYLQQPQAPQTIEVIEIDGKTGASTSKGTYTIPEWKAPWTRSQERDYEQVKVHGVYPQADGTTLLLTAETVFMFVGPNNTNYIATDWFTIRLAPGAAPTRTPIATSEYDGGLVSATHHTDGTLDVVLGGSIETISAGRDDKDIVRFTLDATGAVTATKMILDHVPEAQAEGGFFGMKCGATTMAGDDLLLARTNDTGITVTRYAADGTKTESTYAQPSRCIRSIDLGASGTIYAGMWDTSGVGWRALLTKLNP